MCRPHTGYYQTAEGYYDASGYYYPYAAASAPAVPPPQPPAGPPPGGPPPAASQAPPANKASPGPPEAPNDDATEEKLQVPFYVEDLEQVPLQNCLSGQQAHREHFVISQSHCSSMLACQDRSIAVCCGRNESCPTPSPRQSWQVK